MQSIIFSPPWHFVARALSYRLSKVGWWGRSDYGIGAASHSDARRPAEFALRTYELGRIMRGVSDGGGRRGASAQGAGHPGMRE